MVVLCRTVLLFVLLCPLGSGLGAPLDLSPMPSEYTAEGITIKQLRFKDGKKVVVFEPPRGWTWQGGGAELQLTPPSGRDASAKIQTSPPIILDDATLKQLEDEFIGGLPPQNQNAVIVTRELNPLLVQGNPTFGITVSYDILGHTFVRALLIVPMADGQLRFRLTARKTEFEALHRVWRGSILSWRATETAEPRS